MKSLVCWFLLVASLGARTVEEDERLASLVVRELVDFLPYQEAFAIHADEPSAEHLGYATVFAFKGVLWLYRPERGTESITTSVGQWQADLKQLPRLLAENYGRPVELHALSEAGPPTAEVHTNDCLPLSLRTWHDLAARGVALQDAKLLLFYYQIESVAPQRKRGGHTVLLVRIDDRWRVIDAAQANEQWLNHPVEESYLPQIVRTIGAPGGGKFASGRLIELTRAERS